MSARRLDEIEAREKAATPGPWVVESGKTSHATVSTTHGAVRASGLEMTAEVRCDGLGRVDRHDTDAWFIAHARSDVPWLVERVRKLEARTSALLRHLDMENGGLGTTAVESGPWNDRAERLMTELRATIAEDAS